MESEFHLGEYIAILKRRYIYLILPFILVLGGSIAVAVLLPPVYRSSGTILIESPQIPQEMVSSTVTSLASERIQIIEQRVMTRANLFRISEKFKIFRDDKNVNSTSEAVAKMREMTTVTFIRTNSGKKRRGIVAIAFKVSFEHRRPEVATRVANELVTLFLDENVKSRTARASETTEFLKNEASKLEASLQEVEAAISAYKLENASALPEHLGLHLKMRDRAESEYKELDREIKARLEEKRFLEIEIAGLEAGYRTRRAKFELPQQNTKGGPDTLSKLKANLLQISAIYGPSHPDVKILTKRIVAMESIHGKGAEEETLEQYLATLESQLFDAKQRYSDTHPDIKLINNEINTTREKLQVLLKNLDSPANPEKPKQELIDPIMATVQAKVASALARIQSMQEQKKELRDKITELEARVILTPQVESGLRNLSRDYTNAEKKYNEVRAKQMQAELSENLEEERKSERFVLLEPPILPDEPIRPNRQKMLAIGFVLSLAAGGGGIFLVEMIDGSIRGTASLAAATKLQPLASIPYIVTTREARRRKRIKVFLVLLLLAVMLGALVAIHFLYMPLDIAFYKVLARF